ncbi:MAG: hypothetical protein FWC01_07735 [Treponema sp.]|nr:hypothetical protein [Treponema sp.]MCL2237789.1 hypothetical protein [Treponema sp.]
MLRKIDSGIRDTSASKVQQPKQAAKAASSALAANPRSAPSVLAASALPSDKLSSSIISFAKFFSLSLKPQVLADIRRQALSLPVLGQSVKMAAQSVQSAPQGKIASAAAAMQGEASVKMAAQSVQQTMSLCAAASESKGVELAPKGFEAYVDAVDPDSRRQNDQRRDRQKKDKNENEEKPSLKTESITGDILKKAVYDYMEKDPLMEILNKLPGKNGQRWIVLPFDFTEGDNEYNVSMRILLDSEKISNRAVCMTIDVLSDAGGKREIFIFESANEKITRLCVYQNIEMPEREHHQYKEELSKHFNMPIQCVFVRTSEDTFPFESGFGDEVSTIDEAV